MKFLLDENFPYSSADFIESCGHIALRFNEVCGYGSDDETVFAAAQRLGATILTSDRDFYHTIAIGQPCFHPSGFLLSHSLSRCASPFSVLPKP